MNNHSGKHSTVALGQLESHLWESANILRGPVDAADFKTYIFPLLFFKRICDVWDWLGWVGVMARVYRGIAVPSPLGKRTRVRGDLCGPGSR